MSDVLRQYHQYTDGILSQLNSQSRTKLAREMAKKLRESNRKRMIAQVQPDGTPFTPRKQQKLRGKQGKIKRKMFSKIRTIKYLKISANANSATVSFLGNVQEIAKVHQYGLRDRVNRKAEYRIIYPKRELLGINHADLMMIEQITLAHLAHHS
ncbi:phage virion morphogenesis protein [Orbus sasakiae]|uniref:Phage virion morphogenesis protein n=1 Tax=Orbus sasakiae TaxID=1078475 RepID=A0ABP9NB17_9GAMM